MKQGIASIYLSHINQIDRLSDEDAGKLLKALMHIVDDIGGEEDEYEVDYDSYVDDSTNGILLNAVETIGIETAKSRIEYIKKSEAGKKGGAPKGNENAKKTTQNKQKQAPNEKSENVLVSKKQPTDEKNNQKKEKEKEKLKEEEKYINRDYVDESSDSPTAICRKFNEICISLPKLRGTSENRRKKIQKLNEYLKKQNVTWEEFFQKIEKSDFLTGRDGKWHNCGFDWILNQQNYIKILEGNYDNRDSYQERRKQKAKSHVYTHDGAGYGDPDNDEYSRMDAWLHEDSS